MTKTIYKPQPLFDNLEHFRPTLNDSAEYYKDYTYSFQFLHSYRGSNATFNAYRREIERLLQWSWNIQKKAINQLRREDIEVFIEYCQKPSAEWIGTKNVARFINREGKRIMNPDWRPFVVSQSKVEHHLGHQRNIKNYSLSQNAVQAIFAILGSFYNYLIQEDYIDYNPVAQIRQKSKFIRKTQNKRMIRRLSELQWQYVIETTEILANNEPSKHERSLFIMNALYGMYLRVSELAASPRWSPQMGDFQKDMDGNWWFTTVGKGNKSRNITVSDSMLAALKRYRSSLELPALPSPGEQTPLINKSSGHGAITSTRRIRSIVQYCFDQAYQRMLSDGLGEDAEQLRTATVHWLRHTGISDDVKTRPREHVRDDAGHGSSAITDKYIDIELRERHASGKKKKIKPE
ncbi:MAG: site-specific integrase [Gammaproteobacteria bacterium]|nr:site-specific integrase [Gammaproteobacteria bacterium]MCH9744020.1 site-specific integrase [Gammaproteobacteria bacterium]